MKSLIQLILPPVEDDEWPALGVAFAWFFFILLGYYLVRPVRETLGSILGRDELPWLFLGTFTVMLIANPIYGFLVAKLSRRLLALIVYALIAVCLFGFWLYMREETDTWTARIFFIWVSVYNLFTVSLFWSFLADTFSSQQGKRLFGLVSAGGTLGGLCGSFVAQQIVEQIGMAQLLLIPILLIVVLAALMLGFEKASQRLRKRTEVEHQGQATGGSFFEGIVSVLRSPYLFGICGVLILGKLCATTGYFQQTEIVSQTMADPEFRTQLFARMNLAVQVLTILMQTLLVGRLIKWWGLSAVLCILPVTYAISFLGLGLSSTLAMMVIGRVAQRGTAYGMMAPSQETLFTVVSREDKYKSKAFIDTAVWRGGDVIASFVYDRLRWVGLSLPGVAFAMIPATVVWSAIAWWLGKQQVMRAKALREREKEEARES